jgi:hypothetical protein
VDGPFLAASCVPSLQRSEQSSLQLAGRGLEGVEARVDDVRPRKHVAGRYDP